MMKGGTIIRVEPNIYYLDSRKIGSFGVSGIYIVVGDGLTLIETGTSLIAPNILEAVREIGYHERDIKRSIVTHIHLDHAGATGWLVQRIPNMKVYVHERGARHLLDPSKLIRNAETVYGNLDNILALHGEILPIPDESLFPVSNMELNIGGGISLKIFETPGHAPHHICLFEPETGCLFSGEALGHYIPELELLSPAVAPPGFDLEASKKTLQKIREFNPRTICFSQFGQHRDPIFVIEESERQMDYYYELITTRLEQGSDPDEIIEEILRDLPKEMGTYKYGHRSTLISMVYGFETYRQRMKEINQ